MTLTPRAALFRLLKVPTEDQKEVNSSNGRALSVIQGPDPAEPNRFAETELRNWSPMVEPSLVSGAAVPVFAQVPTPYSATTRVSTALGLNKCSATDVASGSHSRITYEALNGWNSHRGHKYWCRKITRHHDVIIKAKPNLIFHYNNNK